MNVRVLKKRLRDLEIARGPGNPEYLEIKE